MQKVKVKIKKLLPEAKLPAYGSEFAAGADLYALSVHSIRIGPQETAVVHTGLAVEIPAGYVGLIYARSGLATREGLAPANKGGVVDCDYRGEVKVALHNHSSEERTVSAGDRIAQLVITPYITAVFEETEELSQTARGEGGFGSTGSK